jgi:Tfp pilus assembly protein PilO
MNAGTAIDIPRLIRIVSVALAILAGALVFFHFEPQIDEANARVEDARSQLRSSEVLIAAVPRLRAERDRLRRRYEPVFEENPEAVFLRDLASVVRRHGDNVVSSSTGHTPSDSRTASGLFDHVALTLELRGTYRGLLAAIVDLSRGNEIVSVAAPSFRRDGRTLVASVPIEIFEPSGSAP